MTKRIADEIEEANFDQRMQNVNLEKSYAQMAVSPVQLVSRGGSRILKFTTGMEEHEDSGWYSNAFLASAGEDYNYQEIFEELGEVQFLVHLYYVIQRTQGNINFIGLFNTFGQFRFNNILKAIKNGGIALFDPTYRESELPDASWQLDLTGWLLNNQLMVRSEGWNLKWQQQMNQVVEANQLIIPTELFKHAIIYTFTVNYRDMLLSINGSAFNSICRTEAFWYTIGATGISNNTKPKGLSVQPDSRLPDV